MSELTGTITAAPSVGLLLAALGITYREYADGAFIDCAVPEKAVDALDHYGLTYELAQADGTLHFNSLDERVADVLETGIFLSLGDKQAVKEMMATLEPPQGTGTIIPCYMTELLDGLGNIEQARVIARLLLALYAGLTRRQFDSRESAVMLLLTDLAVFCRQMDIDFGHVAEGAEAIAEEECNSELRLSREQTLAAREATLADINALRRLAKLLACL